MYSLAFNFEIKYWAKSLQVNIYRPSETFCEVKNAKVSKFFKIFSLVKNICLIENYFHLKQF